jgi:hypothetical protein
MVEDVEYSLFVLAASIVNIGEAEATRIQEGPFKGNISSGWYLKAAVLVQVSANYLETHRKYSVDKLDHYAILKQDYDAFGALKKRGVVCSFGGGGRGGIKGGHASGYDEHGVKQQQEPAVFVEQGGDAIYLFCKLNHHGHHIQSADEPLRLREGVPFGANLTIAPASKGIDQSVLELELCAHTMPMRRTIWCSNALESMSCGFSSKVLRCSWMVFVLISKRYCDWSSDTPFI